MSDEQQQYDHPSIERIEDALHEILKAIEKHERTLKPTGEFHILSWTEFCRVSPWQSYVNDPIGRSLREGIKRLGQALFDITGSTDAMLKSCHRVCARNRKYWGRRMSIIDSRWNGIGITKNSPGWVS